MHSKSFRCDICDEGATITLMEIQRHMRERHSTDEQNKYTEHTLSKRWPACEERCPQCGLQYRDPYQRKMTDSSCGHEICLKCATISKDGCKLCKATTTSTSTSLGEDETATTVKSSEAIAIAAPDVIVASCKSKRRQVARKRTSVVPYNRRCGGYQFPAKGREESSDVAQEIATPSASVSSLSSSSSSFVVPEGRGRRLRTQKEFEDCISFESGPLPRESHAAATATAATGSISRAQNVSPNRAEVKKILRKDNATSSETFDCRTCGKSFNTKISFSQHLQTHCIALFKHRCEVCLKGFERKSSWKRHSITHTDKRPFICFYCPTSFKREDYLQRHFINKHRDDVMSCRPFPLNDAT